MAKRTFDFILATLGLILTAPLMVPVMILIWLQDFHSPFYVAPRVARGGGKFKMIKLRSMIIQADRTGVDSTKSDDKRITAIGSFVRSYKLDELSQLFNVFWGQMSLVGPRPQVERDVKIYTAEERELLAARPGITDLASIVFADEGDILKGSNDPDLRYNQVIRPWKSRLALLYVRKSSLWLDIRIIFLTAMAIVSRRSALVGVQKILAELNADETLKKMAARETELMAFPPPGATEIVTTR